MKTLVCEAPGRFAYAAVETPALTPGYSLLKIHRIGICGTDLHAFDGSQPYFQYPRILGHELAAEYIAGDAPGFIPGEILTIIPYISCGYCIACASGKPNCCVRIEVCGVHRDGGMADYFLAPSNILMHGRGLEPEALALVEPFAIGAHALSRAAIRPNEYVLVIGAGPIGLGIVELALIAGARPVVMDLNATRLQFCAKKFAGIELINAAEAETEAKLLDITNGAMPTLVIDATGNLRAINSGFKYIAHGGRYILVGLQRGEIGFSHPEFHKREATLMSSRNALKADFQYVMDCMEQKLISPADYITHRMYFRDVQSEFPNLVDPAYGAIKAMIVMED